jgi:hypothetical protein
VTGEKLEFSYERNFHPVHLERRVAALDPPPEGWHADHVLFSSGQAGLATLLQSWLSMLRPGRDQPLRLGLFGAYFETKMLLRLLESSSLSWRSLETGGELLRAIASAELDVVLVESVRYNWELEPLDLKAMIEGWRQRRSAGLSLTIVDTTLSGPFFPIHKILAAVRTSAAPTVVVQYSSGLKLHQLGLELANVGLMSIFSPEDCGTTDAKKIGEYLRAMRTILGSGLTVDETSALEAPWFGEPESFRRHCASVFVNNAMMASALEGVDGIFGRIAHPSLAVLADQVPWAQAPFCVVHLKEDSLENHGLLLGVLAYETKRRGLTFQHGSSFGFRGHRYETIIPKLSDRKGLFKVAMGARGGPSRRGAIMLLRELAAYSNIASLRAAYPQITRVSMDP